MTNTSHPTAKPGPAARLALADGTVFEGIAFGAVGTGQVSAAEVVFNTAMTGYQESLTDPSYAGQILIQTAPLVGNTGANPVDLESGKVQVAGFVVHELTERPSNFRSTQSLSEYLADAGVLGISGIDTRALTRIIRSSGAMPGVLTDRADIGDAELVRLASEAPSMAGRNLVDEVAGREEAEWEETLGSWRPPHAGTVREGERAMRVIAIDCGAKRNILRHMRERGCAVRLVPAGTAGEELAGFFERGEADGLFISNGPGDPAAVEQTVAALKRVLSADDPPATFGICLGHQLVSLAIGAETYKLPFGHRGANQPVREDATGRVEITSQNHGFAVKPEGLEALGAEVTHTHLNDGTVAGLRLIGKPVFSVQYHPEASPGPHDSVELFDRFVEAMRERAGASV